MCLIAYVPKGKALTREVFDNANRINPHGIGVMSAKGVQKFFGNKQLKRARQYVGELAKEGLAHAVHWRFATHGTKGLALCHPFKVPNAEIWIMHNGIIGSTAHDATADASDTLLWVNKLVDAPSVYPDDLAYWTKEANSIGFSNKALIMYPDGRFVILNEDQGIKKDEIWYSNFYSLPLSMRSSSSFVPSRLQSNTQTPFGTGSWYSRLNGTRSSNYGGPFGTMIYWSDQHNAYGWWEGSKFHKVKVYADDIIADEPQQSLPMQIRSENTDLKSDRRCPRCSRFKDNPPAGFLPCWCRKVDVDDFIAKQKAKLDAAHPSGPSADSVHRPASPKVDPCEHGISNWEDCRECITAVEADGSDSVQRWLAHRAGYRIRSTNPDERAQELAEKVIYLPSAKQSNK